MTMMKKFNLEDVKENSKIVDINDVCFNPWNPKIKRSKEYEKVKESVKLNGLGMPIVVREIQDDNYKYQVLDGEQRLTAALDLGYDKVWIVNLGQVSDEEAKSKTLWYEMAVPFDQEQLGKLLVDLVDKVELPYADNEIEVITGISLVSEDDEDFTDDLFDDSEKKKKFVIECSPENLDNIKNKFNTLYEEFNDNQEENIEEEYFFMEMMNKWENQN
jgi:hypothetical protein